MGPEVTVGVTRAVPSVAGMMLQRFGAACGVVLGLSIGGPGAVEAFTGETAATSLVLGLGVAFGPPALTAFYLLSAADGSFRRAAYGLNTVGLGLFACVAFALNVVLFFLSDAVVEDVLDGPTGVVVRLAGLVFVAGTVLFGVTMIRDRAYPTVAAWAYTLSLPALALLAPLKDNPLTSAVHLVAALSVLWLSHAVWTSTRRTVVAV